VRVLVMGTGALGAYLAARLARAGVPVTIAGTWTAGLETMAAHGIEVCDEPAPWRARVAVAHRDGPLPQADVVLVVVKAHQTDAVKAPAARALSAQGVIVTLQNGWGNRETLAEAAPGRVAAGFTFAGITVLGPGRVRGTAGRILVEQKGGTANAVQRLGEVLASADLPFEAVPDIEPHLWSKLAVNCAINPLSALAGVPNGALLAGAESRQSLMAVAREVGAVAAARGVTLTEDPAELALKVAALTSENRSSMLQDRDRGAPTEIDALCGAVVREGRRVGVPTPLNERLWHEVLALTPTKVSA
jgi:2-dehydropantoate 2-reductase